MMRYAVRLGPDVVVARVPRLPSGAVPHTVGPYIHAQCFHRAGQIEVWRRQDLLRERVLRLLEVLLGVGLTGVVVWDI